MAADLHIHAMPDVTEAHMRAMFSNAMGSRYFKPITMAQETDEYKRLEREGHSSQNVWVGEVSWLKAGLLGDSESYVPETVSKVSEIVGEDLPVIDDELIARIREAFDAPNKTAKPDGVNGGDGYSIANVETVVKFLEEHRGEKCFTISW